MGAVSILSSPKFNSFRVISLGFLKNSAIKVNENEKKIKKNKKQETQKKKKKKKKKKKCQGDG